MKKMQKTLVALLCLVCVLSTVFVLFACTDKNANDLEKTVTIVIGEGETATTETVKTTGKYLVDLLIELTNREENKLVLAGEWSQYGLYITEIGNLKQDTAQSQYVYLFISDTEYQNISATAMKREYNGTELAESLCGVSSLPLKDGCVYMFTLVTFSF